MNAIQKGVLLAPFTTFKIGGPAKYFAEAESIDEIQEFCSWAKKNNLPVFILGGGSNLLFSDKGFDGLVIRLLNTKYKIHNTKIEADAGLSLAKLISETVRRGLSGLEWGVGIPGTIGGAIAGNAGAFGKSISDNIKQVEVLDCNNLAIKQFNNSDCDFGYRDSVFKRDGGLVIISAVFNLKKEKPEIIQQRIKDYVEQRNESSAVGQNCAGCFFKNVEWSRKDIDKESLLKNFPELKKFADKPKISAGFLIDFLGLKNKKVGGAMVFPRHANFIINSKDAKAEHVVMLSGLIKQRIFNHYGFALEEEVKLVGF